MIILKVMRITKIIYANWIPLSQLAGEREFPPITQPAEERSDSASEDHPNSGMLHETGSGVKR